MFSLFKPTFAAPGAFFLLSAAMQLLPARLCAAEAADYKKIIEDYKNNAVAAEAKYSAGRTLIKGRMSAAGNMSSSEKDKQYYVDFDDLKWRIRCVIREDNVNVLLNFNKGDSRCC